jgi:hypothetical protein
MADRNRFPRIFFVLCAFGVLSLLAMLGRPSIASIRAVDIVHLLGAGMCIGAAIVVLAVYLRDKQG